jgi:hypothetical protein
MKSIDNGKPPPRLNMVWVCKNCVNEVRILADKDQTGIWVPRQMSILVPHNDRLYCMHWDYVNQYFDVRDTATSSPGPNDVIFRTQMMPDFITPDNAKVKLQVYLLFS